MKVFSGGLWNFNWFRENKLYSVQLFLGEAERLKQKYCKWMGGLYVKAVVKINESNSKFTFLIFYTLFTFTTGQKEMIDKSFCEKHKSEQCSLPISESFKDQGAKLFFFFSVGVFPFSAFLRIWLLWLDHRYGDASHTLGTGPAR